MSSTHRITGSALGGGKLSNHIERIDVYVCVLNPPFFIIILVAFYLAAMGYLAAPAFGLTIDTASAVSAVAAAPVAAKVLAKATVAAPFVYHCLNGIRHLVRNN